MSRSNIPKKKRRILEYLVKNGVAWYSELCRKGKDEKEREEFPSSSKTVLRWLHELESQRLIKVVKKQQGFGVIMGRPKTFYGLTLMGLCRAFSSVDGKLEKYVPIVKDRFKEDLPLVFGKWGHFRKQGVEGIATKHLLDVMKTCSSKYTSFLAKCEQYKGREDSGFFKETREKWMKEESGARRITDVFLYYRLKRRTLVEMEEGFSASPLGSEETSKLISVINEDEELRLYRLIVERRDREETASKNRPYAPEYVESTRSSASIEERLVERLFFKLSGVDPYQEIVDDIYGKDYFKAALKLTRLYVGFPLENIEQLRDRVPSFLKHLVEWTFPETARLEIITLRESGKDIEDDLKKDLDKISVEMLAAQYFYDLEPIKVWNQTFYQVKPHKKRIQTLEEHPGEARAAAFSWAQAIIEELGAKEENKPRTSSF